MIAQITCTNPECYEEIEVDFDYEPAEPETRLDPSYPEGCDVNIIEGCDCRQDEDALEEQLLEWLADREGDTE